jgi:SAM-dependent methyltransferase
VTPRSEYQDFWAGVGEHFHDLAGAVSTQYPFDTGPGAKHNLRGAVGDVRATCRFADASFDAIYSMGTIEHFDDTERAVEEMARVLKPGGRAIVGVPNRHDPFLRPLLATALQAVGLYG